MDKEIKVEEFNKGLKYLKTRQLINLFARLKKELEFRECKEFKKTLKKNCAEVK